MEEAQNDGEKNCNQNAIKTNSNGNRVDITTNCYQLDMRNSEMVVICSEKKKTVIIK